MDKQYFEAVPVSEFSGDKEQFYHVLLANKTPCSVKGKNFGKVMATHYLKPISLTERDKEVAAKAWDASDIRTTLEENNFDLTGVPNKEQYISSLK